jgi:hypothetical protein
VPHLGQGLQWATLGQIVHPGSGRFSPRVLLHLQMGAYKGLYKFGTQTYQSVLGGLALYGTARGALAAGQEVLAAGRGLYAAAGAARALAPVAAAAMLAV